MFGGKGDLKFDNWILARTLTDAESSKLPLSHTMHSQYQLTQHQGSMYDEQTVMWNKLKTQLGFDRNV